MSSSQSQRRVAKLLLVVFILLISSSIYAFPLGLPNQNLRSFGAFSNAKSRSVWTLSCRRAGSQQLSKFNQSDEKDYLISELTVNNNLRQKQNRYKTSSPSKNVHQRRAFLQQVCITMPLVWVSNLPALSLSMDSEEVMPQDGYREPLECSDGAIVAEGAIPGAYQQVCMGLPERSITLKTTGEEIRVFQGTSSSDGGVAGRTGVALWNSGILLTRLLDSLAKEEKDFFKDKTMLELGCGTGLASIAGSKLGARSVIASDGNSEVLQLANKNLERNGIFANSETSNGRASALQWGLLDASDFYDEADIVIGSDLTYNSGTWRLLTETLGAVLKPGGLFIYLTLGHTGFNVSGEVGGFITVVESDGVLEVIEEQSKKWPFQNITSLSSLLNANLSLKEKEVVNGTGGFRILVLQKKQRRAW